MIVKKLLTDIRKFLDTRDNNGWTLLLLAASNGHEIVVKVLLDRNANIEAKDEDAQSPLPQAVNNGHEKILKVMLDKNANIVAKDKSGEKLLFRPNLITRALLKSRAEKRTTG